MASGIRLQKKLSSYTNIVKAISHPHRVAVVYLLAHESLRTRDLMQKIGVKQSVLVHHLKAMEHTGWVQKQREGKHMVYSLQKKAFKEIIRLLSDTPFGREFVTKKLY